ncbi:MAG: transglutaminase domain-containing protein [Marmoricola sp.]|nr:transglutaminase domain-containing protein [Marmoricola sp.]
MTRAWTRLRVGPALLALCAGWFATVAWSGMVAHPHRYLQGGVVIGLLVMLTGIAARALRSPMWATITTQVVVGLLGLNVLAGHAQSILGVVPTPASVHRTWFEVVNGAATLNQYSSPVQVNPLSTGTMLAACGVGVILAVDALALTVRKAPLAALPLLGALSVPVSILREGLALPVFVITALLFLRLVASDHLASYGAWSGSAQRPVGSTMTTFWQVAVAAVVAALLLTPLVPVSDLLKHTGTGGAGPGNGNSVQLTTVNPFIRLRRDLVQKTHTPLVYATTDAQQSGYLRTTVLDQFTSDEWDPSPRNLPSDNDADGPFPDPPGLAAGAKGTTSHWKISLDANFATGWAPTPYPVINMRIGEGWRYDTRTLDVAYVAGGAPTPLSYDLTAFSPTITSTQLRTSLKAPDSILGPMTRLPQHFPSVIRQQAEKVTKGADNDFDKAVALQDWFRSGGGFTYSLDQQGGSGMDMLAHFVTDDRVGYCEQFASAMAAMGRSLGIPSRVVVGFLDGSPLPDGRILYTSDERHAWPEMYFAGVGWVRFEPTPAQRAGDTPTYTRSLTDPTLPTPSATAAPSRAPVPKHDIVPVDQSSSHRSSSTVPWRPIGVVLLLVLVLLTPATARSVQRRRRLHRDDAVHLAEGAWAELGATAHDLGLDWPEQRSPREQARRMSAQVEADPDDLASLEGLLTDVERGRYAPSGAVATVEPEARERTLSTVETWRHAMAATVKGSWRARLWPTSLLRRRRQPRA